MKQIQVIVIGAGPCGLSAAIELKKQGIETLIIEKKCLVHSIYRYPTHLQFFSTTEMLEIGDLPFTSPNDKPYRDEALVYYRKAAERYDLNIRSYEEVTEVHKREDGMFHVSSITQAGESCTYEAKYVILATGYFDHPNMIGIPGEDSPHVTHYFQEAHPYADTDLVIIGGNNSAIDAALECMRVGARVTIVYRGGSLSASIKPWVRPIFESMLNKGLIRMVYESRAIAIHPHEVIVEHADMETESIPCQFVLALTGFRPDRKMLEQIGVELQDDREKPVFAPSTMQTNIEGLYVAGVISSGRNANEIFIETGRGHGRIIADHITSLSV
ncbi:YpdA family putative bacillithiol disulfide reductase [Paenibacillus marinisediminis]